MFSRFRKEKHPQNSTPINPNIEGFINNAMRIRHAHQPTPVDLDPPDPRDQMLVAGPSTSVPVDMSCPSTSTSAQAIPQAGGRCWISSSVSIGQDRAFNEVCKFLKQNDVGMVGIYGMGGVGKTTLMKKVRNEFLELSSFKVVSIVVSKTVNVDRIQEDIMREMNLHFEKDAHPHKRARDIGKEIGNYPRKLALLFDDIWEVLDLDLIGVSGGIGFNTSTLKIIFTTRLEDVCSHMQADREIKIQPLGWDDSWALFAKNVGTKTLHSKNEILDLAKSVAEECGGLPLALTVIGRAMTCRYSLGAWEDALSTLQKSPLKFSRTEERLFSVLKLSYDNIRSDLEKECFLFCCLYPEDWIIDRRELVEFWIGDGILDFDGSYHETYNRGCAIIDGLLAASLIEEKYQALTMHDIIRDLGLWIASESRYFVHGGKLKLTKDHLMNRWKEAHGIYVLREDDLPERPHCENLSALIFCKCAGGILKLRNNLFSSMDKLRILKGTHIEFSDTSHDVLGQLVELRYLSLYGTNLKRFPMELGNFRKLIVLEIEFKGDIMSIPPAIGQLTELRRLSISPIEVLPIELGKLSKLEELVLRKHANCINQIPEGIFLGMAELRTLKLCMTNVSIFPADFWNLNKLEHLRIECLEIQQHLVESLPEYPSPMEDGAVEEIGQEDVCLSCIQGLKRLSKCLRVVEMRRWPIFKWGDMESALKAKSELSKLIFDGFLFDEIIITSKSSCFSKLIHLNIAECPKLEKLEVGGDGLNGLSSLTVESCASLIHIIGLEHLQCLKHLNILSCPLLEGELIKPNEGIGSSPIMCMPCLEFLHLRDLPHLRMICSDSVSFPCLSHLHICCRRLKKFPRGLMNEKRPLQGFIFGQMKWWEGLQWQDKDFKSYLLHLFSPGLIPAFGVAGMNEGP